MTLRGTAFIQVAQVLFGDRRGRDLEVRSPSRISVTAPPHAAGWVYVRVVTSHGTSPPVSADRFRYVSPPTVSSVQPAVGPTAGGTTLTVTGEDFLHVATVLVGGAAATSVSVDSDHRLTAVTPAHAAGTVNVRVITGYGRSILVDADHYVYEDPPTSNPGR